VLGRLDDGFEPRVLIARAIPTRERSFVQQRRLRAQPDGGAARPGSPDPSASPWPSIRRTRRPPAPS